MRQWEQLHDTWDADAVVPIGDFIDVGDVRLGVQPPDQWQFPEPESENVFPASDWNRHSYEPAWSVSLRIP
jgi:hypothetical protein